MFLWLSIWYHCKLEIKIEAWQPKMRRSVSLKRFQLNLANAYLMTKCVLVVNNPFNLGNIHFNT